MRKIAGPASPLAPGAASHAIGKGNRFRLSLMSAAVCAALVSHAPAAPAGPDACSGSVVVICQGNQSAGVQFSAGVGALNVLNLATDITPASGVSGIRLLSTGSDGAHGIDLPFLTHGGAGQNSGSLTINLHGDGRGILTHGASAFGMFAASLGGDGGNGVSFIVVGGSGGTGGNAGSVTITSNGAITTTGADAHGIYALGDAGDGGHGGNGVGPFGEGGNGGRGGAGGAVTVRSDSAIATSGADAHGIVAQSLGGAGGNGGAGLGLVGKGGAAAGSGPGGDVAVTSTGVVTTRGSDARGVFAQSVGGFAGDAGAGVGFYAFGGSGESSGDGGDVTITNRGAVTTGGHRSDAVFAHSVGGGGGIADLAFAQMVALGGSGAAGGNGGAVTVTNASRLETAGEKSSGVFAQSVGGGGGDGAVSVAMVSIGGSGGAAGSGGTVTVNNCVVGGSGQCDPQADHSGVAIKTGGGGSPAIFAQSIGGGGGDGGTSEGAFNVGGSGSAGGNGGSVVVTNSGRLETAGADASAILAQSIGGGGGSGGGSLSLSAWVGFGLGGSGDSGGSGGAVDVRSHNAMIDTQGDRAHGILAQSVGGGGGTGGFAITATAGLFGDLSVAVGRSGGGGGNGNSVDVNSQGAIATRGEDAHGLFAQSVGGGGGSGGFSIAGAGSDGVGVALAFGGSGGSGGDGQAVDVVGSGTIDTGGHRSVGLLAQSVGGGGGNGGFRIAGSGGGLGGVSLTLGGNGNVGGNGGAVVVRSTLESVNTRGDEGHGVAAQSLGGGGGWSTFSVAGSGGGTFNVSGNVGSILGTAGGNGGDGDTVELFSDSGSVTTSGGKAYGLLAQSAGGGGGFGGVNIAGGGAGAVSVNGNVGSVLGKSQAGIGGDSKAVTLTSTNMMIDTSGARSGGIVAQSAGGGGGFGGVNIAGGGAGAVSVSGNLSSGLGSSGGAGGVGGTVGLASSFDRVTTRGDDAHGVLAQSAGGGGGMGAVNVALSGAGSVSVAANVGSILGSAGGVGGDSNTVTLTSTNAAIDTFGARSAGMVAQSAGGGGGFGGVNVSASGAGSVSVGTNVSSGLGSSGGGGGAGGTVRLSASAGTVTTRGEDAPGLMAESVGGGGGVGAVNVGGSGAGSVSVAANVDSVLGSSGAGGGGDAKDVTLASTDMTITTALERATGIVAQSLGGGGGFGGVNIAGSGAGSVSVAGNVSSVLGNSAGAAGDGGIVNLVSDGGSVTTLGAAAHGLLAQSVGGGGGMGAVNVAGGGAGSVSVGGSVSSVLGSGGGNGGEGKAVTVASSSGIKTSGAGAIGLFAQSLGGGGGYGGVNIAGSGAGKVSASVALGGSGGAGGSGDKVTVDSGSAIVTLGSDAPGLLAQSVGGGGGVGASSWSGSVDPTADSTWNVTVGGAGGGGAKAGDVRVENAGSIDTYGPGSHGLVAQSLGGGGGAGGQAVALGLGLGGTTENWDVNAVVAVGGSGGGGNIAGRIDLTNTGRIITRVDDAHGIFAQSVGGGGGSGGSSFTAHLSTGAPNAGRVFNGTILVGGSGGSGNDGGVVSVTNRNAVDTWGDKSHGISVQSIGGGGGNGGTASGIVLLLEQGSAQEPPPTVGEKWDLSVSVGGSGGTGNNGGSVRADNSGRIETRGTLAHGILAQSIGGGGGSGGDGLEAREVKDIGTLLGVDHGQAIFNAANQARRYLLPGEGSDSGEPKPKLRDKALEKLREKVLEQLRDISITVGGNAGASGNAAEVLVNNGGDIVTSGYGSVGILAQSVGGGGGIAQTSVKAENAGGSAAGGATGKLAIGGAGGAAGDGGAVRVDHRGRIDTFGDEAHGVFAQSVGGGGGVAGNVERPLAEETCPPEWAKSIVGDACLPPVNIGLGVGWGRPGGSGGNGGAVTTATSGDITTRGAGAHGIKAQSIGGGGGAGGGLGRIEQAITGILFDGTVGGAGSGGVVTVTHTGNITTLGHGAYGIFAQSAGGTNTGGKIHVAVSGNVIAQGEGSHGIFSQSIGGQGGGDISIRVDGGTVQGGSGTIRVFTATHLPAAPDAPPTLLAPIDLPVAGVRIEGGANNTLTSTGTVTTLAGPRGMAVSGTTGNETIDNFGTVTGSADLGAGTNAFSNRAGAMFNAGAQVALGAGNTLTNAGTLAPGASGLALTTALSGNLRQPGSGVLALELDHASGTSDRVAATGTADVAGAARVGHVNPGRVRPGAQTYTIVSSAGGVTDSGLKLETQPSAVIGYQLAFPNATDVVVQTGVDFAPGGVGLNANQLAIGGNVNAIQAAGGSTGFEPIATGLLALPDAQSLAAAYDRLSPEGYLAIGSGTLFSSAQFSDALLSCRVLYGAYRFVREGECGWLRLAGGSIKQDQTSSNFGFDRDAVELAGGWQRAIDDTWHLGFGLAYEASDLDVAGLSSTDGDQVHAGATLKGRSGATTYSGAVSVGYGWYDTRRLVNLPAPGVVATSDQNLGFIGARFRLAHAWEPGPNWYVRPMVDAAVTYARFNGFQESGAGGANLQVAGRSETWVSVTPALEVGGEFRLRDFTLARPSVKVGVTRFVSGTDPQITASFEGAPAGVGPFSVSGKMDRTFADVEAGMDLLRADGAVLRLSYVGRFSDHLSSNAGMIKVSVPF